MTAATLHDWPAFIRQNTALLNPPLVPEIRLHLAEESLPIWRKTEEELGEMNVPPPFWAFAWAGGQALARYLIDTPELAAGKSVLDLGTGSGLTAIAAMMAGASDVLASDIDAVALHATRLNAEVNGVDVGVCGDDLLACAPDSRFGLVLVADLFYERALADLVLGYIERAVAGGAIVLIGDPQRSYFPRDRFVEVAHYSVPVTRELEDAEIKRTAVWRLG
ncbi:MAG: methyltransferase [Hyphomicrobiaceae bacterium]